MPRARRTDSTQKDVVNALRAAGFSVRVTSGVGQGFSDLVVGVAGLTVLLEVKSSAKEVLTEEQEEFRDSWKGSYLTCYSAVGAIMALRRYALSDVSDVVSRQVQERCTKALRDLKEGPKHD